MSTAASPAISTRRCRLSTSRDPKGKRVIDEDLRPVKVDAKVHASETCRFQSLGHVRPVLRQAVEHQEPAAPGPGDLAADRAFRSGQLIEAVDPGIGDSRRQALLVLPRGMQEFAEFLKAPPFEAAAGLHGHRFDGMQRIDYS